MRRLLSALSIAAILATATTAGTVAAPPFPHTIVLPGASSAEGIATGTGSTFYAGDLFGGDIFRGDLRTGAVERFIDAPAGRNALGIRVDEKDGLLFVAGGFTGQGYVYDLATGAPIASDQFGTPPGSIINDVIVSDGAAWFTDSVQPHLYRVPITGFGSVGAFATLTVTGPAAELTGGFNLNGIAAAPDGTLIVAHTANRTLYTVDPATGASALIEGADLPNVDGILLDGHRLWAVRNLDNQIVELRLSGDLSSATIVRRTGDNAFEVPTTVARWGNRLATVNAKFDTGFPPSATTFEVVEVNAR
jgi:sugar lactone lactonase YvrE